MAPAKLPGSDRREQESGTWQVKAGHIAQGVLNGFAGGQARRMAALEEVLSS